MNNEQSGSWSTTLYQGSLAVRRRLESIRLPNGGRLSVLAVEMYRSSRENVWEAKTNDGRRWVSWTEKGGWVIAKVPPGRRRT